MSVKLFLSSCKRLIKMIGRPNRGELWIFIKIGLIGIGILGIIGFIIKFISTMLQPMPG